MLRFRSKCYLPQEASRPGSWRRGATQLVQVLLCFDVALQNHHRALSHCHLDLLPGRLQSSVSSTHRECPHCTRCWGHGDRISCQSQPSSGLTPGPHVPRQSPAQYQCPLKRFQWCQPSSFKGSSLLLRVSLRSDFLSPSEQPQEASSTGVTAPI